MSSTPDPALNRFPPQTKYIVGNEACERFSYYGMRSILAGYVTGEVLKGGLGQSEDTATTIIHTFVFANYFMPLFGAWLSDKLVGRYHTILWVSLFYCAGHGTLACSDFFPTVPGKLWCLYVGLALIAFGSGGIKPCVSAFMGDQFKPEQAHLLQKAYGAFYWSINLGSFFSFLVVPWVKNHHGYSWAFGVPGILMAIATLIFWIGTKHYVRVPPSRQTRSAGFFKVFFAALSRQSGAAFEPWFNMGTILGLPTLAMAAMTFVALQDKVTPFVRSIGWAALVCVALWYATIVVMSLVGRSELPEKFWLAARGRYSDREISAARTLGPILIVFALVPVFWSLFDQTNSTWVLQGGKMVPFVLSGEWIRTFLVFLCLGLMFLSGRGGDTAVRLVLGALSGLALIIILMQLSILPSGAPASTWFGFIGGLVAAAVSLAVCIKGRTKLVRIWLSVPASLSLLSLAFPAVRRSFLSLSYTIGAEEMQSANPALVMILVPLLTLALYPRLGRLASPLKRMSYGMFLAASSYVIVGLLQARIEAGAQLSVAWQTLPYIVLTTAEVLVSTTGLEFAFREAAKEMKSTIMSFWLLTVAFGNILVAAITKTFSGEGGHAEDASVSTSRFFLYAGLTFIVAILFSLVAMHYRYQDKEAAEGR